jgi:hypothetical protein
MGTTTTTAQGFFLVLEIQNSSMYRLLIELTEMLQRFVPWFLGQIPSVHLCFGEFDTHIIVE